MNNFPATPKSTTKQASTGHGRVSVLRLFKLIFINGPWVLLTSQITVKCAAFMIIMCAPALFFSAMLTIPGLVFQSPQQNAYYYFAMVLDQDPTRWIVLGLTGLCAVLSLALPATMEKPRDAMDY